MWLRVPIGLVLSAVIWFAYINYAHLPKDRYLPPYYSYGNVTEKTGGIVVAGLECEFMNHWIDGNTGAEWFMDYKFQPKGSMTTWQTGRVGITEEKYKKTWPGAKCKIAYDPANPVINTMIGSEQYNFGVLWISGWIWYAAGFLATALVIAEFLKRWIRYDIKPSHYDRKLI